MPEGLRALAADAGLQMRECTHSGGTVHAFCIPMELILDEWF